MTSPEPVRCGLIGYGLFGAHHARALQQAPHAELVAIAVPSEKSQSAARKAFPKVKVCGDYRELLAHEDIELVDIVVPNHLHFEVAEAALAAGKNVLLEKPMALHTDHCDRLVELARSQHRLLAINHELRLSSLWGGVRELIDRGAIGRVQHVLIELSRFPYRYGSEGWRYDIDRVGNWILEEPIHFFDLARWYLEGSGDPVSVYARANSRHADQPELRDNFSCIVDFEDGAFAVISQTLAAFGHHQTAKIAGTKGTIWAYWSAADARSDRCQFGLRYGLADEVHEVTFDKATGELLELADQVAAVVQAVLSRSEPPCSGEDGRWSTRLCLAATRSVELGRIVTLSEL